MKLKRFVWMRAAEIRRAVICAAIPAAEILGFDLWRLPLPGRRIAVGLGAPLRAWLSAHVYLGLALLVVMPLHSAFELGWNIHTLALALATLTIATGIAGLGFYTQVPTPMTRNRPGQKLAGLLEQIADLD